MALLTRLSHTLWQGSPVPIPTSLKPVESPQVSVRVTKASTSARSNDTGGFLTEEERDTARQLYMAADMGGTGSLEIGQANQTLPCQDLMDCANMSKMTFWLKTFHALRFAHHRFLNRPSSPCHRWAMFTTGKHCTSASKSGYMSWKVARQHHTKCSMMTRDCVDWH